MIIPKRQTDYIPDLGGRIGKSVPGVVGDIKVISCQNCTICYHRDMKKYLKNIAGKFVTMEQNSKSDNLSFTRAKRDEAIRFTIKTYGETFRDLAKYDRGESFSR